MLPGKFARLRRVRCSRDDSAVGDALARLRDVARGEDNMMPAILEAVRAYATVGEISRALADVFGHHQPVRTI
jgi:methylmalonyl-CoA mutase N-terminal domain/subunit